MNTPPKDSASEVCPECGLSNSNHTLGCTRQIRSIQPPAPPAAKAATPRTDAIMGQFRLALRGQTSEECITHREAAESGIADLETELAEAKARLDTVLTGNEPGGLQDWMDQATQARIQNVALDERCALLKGLIRLGDNESRRGKFRVTLDYDNYQDGARVLDGNGKVLGECYELGPDELEEQDAVEWQFVEAIKRAITPTTQPAERKGRP